MEFTADSIKAAQRTEKGLKFERWYDELRNLLHGRTKADQQKAILVNQNFCRGMGLPTKTGSDLGYIPKAVNPGNVHVDVLLSTFSKMYANDEYIGERLMPPISVTSRSNKYAVYPKRERFSFPDDSLTTRARANEVEATRTTDNYSVKDYGLMEYLDLETLANQDAPFDEMLDLAESVNEGISFRREKRIAAIIQNSSNYGSNTANAATKWDTANTGGSIISDMLAAKQGLFRGRNRTRVIGVTTLSNWNVCIINNPALTDKYKYTNAGLLTPQLVAGWFGLDDLLIAAAREDTANEGQTESYSRMWTTDFFGLISVATSPTLRSLQFGSTFRMSEDPVTTEWFDPEVGKKGGNWLRVAVSEDHKIVAGDAGFFINDVQT